MSLAGRAKETSILNEAYKSQKAEMVAVIGRRRVGKTFMIREYFKKQIFLEFVGIYNGTQDEHMERFAKIEQTYLRGKKQVQQYQAPKNWFQLFDRIERLVETSTTKAKKVIFLDELPWMGGSNSRFIKALGHFWNAWASKRSDIVLIISGSSTSWILKKVFKDKGGLYNRTTKKIILKPFSLAETEQFLLLKRIYLERDAILDYYMILGGIPYYLDMINPGESIVQTVDRLFFQKESSLNQEFDELYSSLFEESALHEKITKLLSQHSTGLTREEILARLRLGSGGSYSKVFNDLENAHFISSYVPFGKKIKDKKYKLSDAFILFYFKYVHGNKGVNVWEKNYNTVSWKSWSGLAFENICMLHITQIKNALMIGGIMSEASFWFHRGTSDMHGAQIDMLIDRADKVINICEIKYYTDPIVVSKKLIEDISGKITSFRFFSGTRKTIFPILISPKGVVNKDQIFFTKVINIDHLFQ
jgi:uncharacterized protein